MCQMMTHKIKLTLIMVYKFPFLSQGIWTQVTVIVTQLLNYCIIVRFVQQLCSCSPPETTIALGYLSSSRSLTDHRSRGGIDVSRVRSFNHTVSMGNARCARFSFVSIKFPFVYVETYTNGNLDDNKTKPRTRRCP